MRSWLIELRDEGLQPGLKVHRTFETKDEAQTEELRQCRGRIGLFNLLGRTDHVEKSSDLRSRVARTEALMERQRSLGITLAQWHRSIKAADPSERGVAYLTLRRILEGAIPTHRTLDKLEAGIDREEASRDGSATAAA